MEENFDAITITLITLPAHGFLHIKNRESDGYFDFWGKQDKIPGQDCDTITRLLATIKEALDGQVMARLFGEDSSWEAYGIRLPADYAGPVPHPLLLTQVAEADYISFEHGPFDYEGEGEQVYRLLVAARQGFSYDDLDFEPDLSAGRLSYYYFDPDRYARYVLPIRSRQP